MVSMQNEYSVDLEENKQEEIGGLLSIDIRNSNKNATKQPTYWMYHIKVIGVTVTIVCGVFVALTAGLQRLATTKQLVQAPFTLENTCVRPTGALFETDCNRDDCDFMFAMDGNTAVVFKKDGSSVLQFYTMTDGKPKRDRSIRINHDDIRSIDISGNTAVVGEENAVHIYENTSNGQVLTSIQPPEDLLEDYFFGSSVSIDGDTLVIGTRKGDGGSMFIYHCTGNTWELKQSLLARDAEKIGFSTSANHDTVLGGSLHGYDFNWHCDIKIQRFNKTSQYWEAFGEDTLEFDDCGGDLGISVLKTNDGILLSDPSNNIAKGALYYYREKQDGIGFELPQKITPSDGIPGDLLSRGNMFGANFASHGNFLVVGTLMDFDGSVYIYEKQQNEWKEVAIIKAPREEVAYFGARVAISTNHVLVYSANNIYSYVLEECKV